MKTRNVSSSRRIWISCCGMLLLTALVFCVLPRIVPYERINVFYGLGEGTDRRAVDSLPANQGSCAVYLLMDNLMNIPQTSLLANGAIRIYVASQSLKAFAGNSGAVMTVTVKATAPVSHATVALRGSKAVEPVGTKHTLDDSEAVANAGAQTVTGDVTGDGRVDIADVNAVINIMLGKAPSVPAADINGNGTVDIADVNAAINIMLGK